MGFPHGFLARDTCGMKIAAGSFYVHENFNKLDVRMSLCPSLPAGNQHSNRRVRAPATFIPAVLELAMEGAKLDSCCEMFRCWPSAASSVLIPTDWLLAFKLFDVSDSNGDSLCCRV